MFNTSARHRSARRRRRTIKAFSLIELTLVLAIAGVTFAIAAPRYGASLDRYRADITARRVAADLLLAQSRARTASRSQTVTFDLTASSYWLDGEAGAERSAERYTVRLTESPYLARLGSLSWNDTATITFNGYGVPSRSGTITVRSGSTQRRITVAAESGAVSIQ